jgi:AHBA synthesis associated protein
MLLRSTDPIPRAELRAVVFDLDGVLVDSQATERAAFRAAYAQAVGAGEAPVDEFARYGGWYFPDVLRAMNLPVGMELPYVRESYRLADLTRVHVGVRSMLNVLRLNGIRTAVATGRSAERAKWLLDRLRLLPLLDAVVGGDEVPRGKPAPDLVIRALARLRVTPDAAVVVGDAVTDLRSARAAGVTAAAAVWDECRDADLLAAEPDLVLRRPADVLMLCDVDRRAARVAALAGYDFRDCA